MRIVIQRVKNASVIVANETVSSIGKGLMILVGISTKDTIEDVSKMSRKIVNLRLFEDLEERTSSNTEKYSGKPWAKSVMDEKSYSILSVSQFTLYGTIKKGTKPDFHAAQKGELAKELYDTFLQRLRGYLGDERVKDGKFGEMMEVNIVNDGPVTIVWDTQNNI
ncbi:D-tyrosyl-tRNA(Tyr) deacylase [Yamadazyma tenuis]|uniref:D-aminoacyl-tRNA deacylase n=1 Tax=Candida tenuis (strain ATCC 10573 / BCRC 21748 / CBS 615 / JCM 9827 / NBRC 10315 / NRRL Y-1498 / VKM Y-70) TaxID=590646 RepID=G3AY69_CANTC|nr:D-tyrosyl-tRNA deacylase [Yamadazyma tenuis ATCC 10573]EGV65779.1 D-tyrosyl-tRNA deacylase [Yamadazyma tenuis ATCC 10573]WEJ95896.1 D-tyrosyl-tRNA(Tyr) deacylase [Yamadazyma tenuis]